MEHHTDEKLCAYGATCLTSESVKKLFSPPRMVCDTVATENAGHENDVIFMSCIFMSCIFSAPVTPCVCLYVSLSVSSFTGSFKQKLLIR